MLVGLMVAGVAVGSARIASAEEWEWFRASPGGARDAWWLLHGKAEVQRTHGRFNAVLHDSDDYSFIRQSLQGTVSGRRVRAQVTTLGSDAPVYQVSGMLKRSCWRGEDGRESVILTSGFDVIGLARTVSAGTPCKPTH
jgi:hypothetical protein